MSEYSENWHRCSPAKRDFYRNYGQRHLVHAWKADPPDPFSGWVDFLGETWYWLSSPGWALAYRNWFIQCSTTLEYDIEVTWWTVDAYFPPPIEQPLHHMDVWGDLPNVFLTVPEYADNYPRPKYNVRRHYWTGQPRRRMNYAGP